jgi:hypothetical protein
MGLADETGEEGWFAGCDGGWAELGGWCWCSGDSDMLVIGSRAGAVWRIAESGQATSRNIHQSIGLIKAEQLNTSALSLCHLKNLPTRFPAIFLANPLPIKAVFARFDAWLNLSHRENATVFVMVRINAIAIIPHVSIVLSSFAVSVDANHPRRQPKSQTWAKLTHNNQPNGIQQPHHRQHRQRNPQRRRHIHAQPEEAPIRRIDDAGPRFRGLEDPVRVSRRGVDLIPPAQANQAAAGDVF